MDHCDDRPSFPSAGEGSLDQGHQRQTPPAAEASDIAGIETASPLSHFGPQGASRMVDVGAKEVTVRTARASGVVRMAASTLSLVRNRRVAKGEVLEVARLAGIMAAKRTFELIPLCHPLPLDGVTVDFEFRDDETLAIQAEARATARTGVEMEAMMAVSVAALTVYDMLKAVDRQMTVERVCLEEKSGGKSGHFRRTSGESL